MKRATIATRIYEPEGGAAAFRLGSLVRELQSRGFDLTVVTTRPPTGERTQGNVRRWPVLRDRAGSVRGYLQYASFDIPLFVRLFRGPRPDVFVVEPPPTTGFVTRLVARMRRVPYVYYAADVSSRAAAGVGIHPVVVSVLRRAERWVIRGAARVLAVSDGVRAELVNLGIKDDRIDVVGTGVDSHTFTPDGDLATDGRVLVYAGTMSEIQGAEVFVEAFGMIADEHPDVRLVMLGSGTAMQELRAISNERVLLLGTRSGEETAKWLRSAVAALASVRPNQGYDFAFATKAFAAVACGTPVIYAGVGPAGQAVADNDLGWSTEWSAPQVALAMRTALERPPSAESTRTRERRAQWVRQFHSLNAVSARAVDAIYAAIER